jgi:hypothetical protein
LRFPAGDGSHPEHLHTGGSAPDRRHRALVAVCEWLRLLVGNLAPDRFADVLAGPPKTTDPNWGRTCSLFVSKIAATSPTA